jgi:hypothetical protein
VVDNSKPPAKVILDFHTNSDIDGGPSTQHHSLGLNRGQASPGDHMHDGSTSKLILTGVTISGAKGGNTALASVIAALVNLGATDAST